MRVALSFTGCHRRGGVERVMLEAANYLAEKDHDVQVFTSEWDTNLLTPRANVHRITVPDRPSTARVARFAWQSAHSIEKLTPPADVMGSFGVLAPPGSVTWVQSVHAAWLEISRQRRGTVGRLKQRMNRFHPLILRMERSLFGARHYGKLIALTDQVKADLIRIYSVPERDIVVIPNGFAKSEFNCQRAVDGREGLRSKLGYRPSDKVVIFVANELERKGFGPLLRAIVELNDSSIHLLVVGRVNGARYAREIRRLGMDNRIQFAGSADDVACYYGASDIFALPTQYEAWGLVIVEAMACGLPVLTSRLAGAAVAVKEGQTGQLLDDPDNVEEITSKLGTLVAGSHAEPDEISVSVSEYAWDRILPRYEQTLIEHANSSAISVQTQIANARPLVHRL